MIGKLSCQYWIKFIFYKNFKQIILNKINGSDNFFDPWRTQIWSVRICCTPALLFCVAMGATSTGPIQGLAETSLINSQNSSTCHKCVHFLYQNSRFPENSQVSFFLSKHTVDRMTPLILSDALLLFPFIWVRRRCLLNFWKVERNSYVFFFDPFLLNWWKENPTANYRISVVFTVFSNGRDCKEQLDLRKLWFLGPLEVCPVVDLTVPELQVGPEIRLSPKKKLNKEKKVVIFLFMLCGNSSM